MTMPPGLLGLTLLFWGWETGLLPVAVVGAVVLELPHAVRWRWDFAATDMNRVWDLCVILFVGAALYAYATTDITTGPGTMMPWLPIILFPFAAATAYSAHDQVRFSTYFWLWRKPERATEPDRPLGVFVPYWYFAACFTAASIVNARDERYYLAVVGLGAWLLWSTRSRMVPRWVWGAGLLGVAVAGLQGQIGLTRIQELFENRAMRLLSYMTASDIDVTQTRTAIGAVGRLQQSGRIILRLEAADRGRVPELLRKASFSSYDSSTTRAMWTAVGSEFSATLPATNATTWPLVPAVGKTTAATVSMMLPRGVGILPVPNGPVALEELLAVMVQTNRYGAIRVREAFPLVRYTVKYAKNSTLDAPPRPADLKVPETEKPAVAQIAAQLALDVQPPAETMRRVAALFQDKYTYTRYLRGANYDPGGRETALSQFLLQSRAGHCEYFATAATLLLRQAGIPARYAIGFAVPEPDSSRRTRIVRARHAHAWTLAYVDGAWHDFDATPVIWHEIEDEQRSLLEFVADAGSWLRYIVARWRYYGELGAGKYVLWLAPVVLLWFGWRIFARRRRVRAGERAVTVNADGQAGLDSEFYQIEHHLAQLGVPRRPGEPLRVWLDRVATANLPGLAVGPLHDIVALHYAYRFDPQGISTAQRAELRERVVAWLPRP